MTLKEQFEKEKITLEFIENRFDVKSNDYWKSALAFIKREWEFGTEFLTAKQQRWADKILEDCIEKRIEG